MKEISGALSQKQLIRNFNKAALTFDQAAFLFSKINQSMLDRLDLVSTQPKLILDCGAGTGLGSTGLLKKYKKSSVISFDLSIEMLKQCRTKKRWLQKNYVSCGDAHALPFASNSFDLVYANLMLHWCSDIKQIFSEWRRVLKPNGLVLFTAFGPDTLKELYASLRCINPNSAVQQFVDMHDLGDLLLKTSFLEPVMDVDYFQIQYNSVNTLLRELRDCGIKNLHAEKTRACHGKRYLDQLKTELKSFKTDSGKIPLTIEVVYGHAWVGDTKSTSRDNRVVEIPLQRVATAIRNVRE